MEIRIDINKKLNDFPLQVQYEGKKEIIGILGPSGCGKSMTLKSIAGIEIPDSGRIEIGDRVLFDSSKRINLKPQQRQVGYLFQNYALFPTMTVAENIMAGLKGSRKEKRKIADELIERFQLNGLAERYPGQLSGGQQQRTALARIMACKPQALLLDEPFSAMDIFLRERLRLEMLELLKSYQGVSILVTHDRNEAYQLCDQLLVMDQGKIIDYGPVKELFRKPGTVQSARLTGCKNISRIEAIGEYRVRALDWGNLELTVSDRVTPDCSHVGIRAHDFVPAAESAGTNVNIIPLGEVTISELPFEWYIMLPQNIWWKISKSEYDGGLQAMPQALYAPPEKLFLMRAR